MTDNLSHVSELAKKYMTGELTVESHCRVPSGWEEMREKTECSDAPETESMKIQIEKYICTPEGRAEIRRLAQEMMDDKRLLTRPTWDDTNMEMLPPLERRATCYKHQVACLLFDPVKKDIIKVGYNGAPHGKPHCSVAVPVMDGLHHINCIHAETNCIIKSGEKAEGAWLYCSLTPCRRCAILCVQAKISRFIYRDEYNIAGSTDMDFVRLYFEDAGIELTQWKS